MSGQAIIETRDLTKRYGTFTAVDRLNLAVEEGEIFGLLGPNGAGKTTAILMLLGLTRPSGGWARVCGFDPTKQVIQVKSKVGYLPENVGFYDDMTARENLRYVTRLNGIPDELAEEKMQEALEIVELSSEADKRAGTFSRGMRQRLGIAEVLVKDPKVVILDEPTLGLDPDGAIKMIELIERLSKEKGITVLFSSHQLQQVQKISNRIGIMFNGRLVAVGPIDQLAQEKLGIDKKEYTLEELYMQYFKEGQA
jgi:ABC-2 type transport system ATP-binding protein